MKKIQIELPDEVAERAKSEGLLSDRAIQHLLEDAMRRKAGRELLSIAQRIQAAGIEPMSLEEIDAEVKAVRTDTHRRRSQGGSAGRS
jgi:hypothetical protein